MDQTKIKEFEVDQDQIYAGIFWVISDSRQYKDYELLIFNVSCDSDGNIIDASDIMTQSKMGDTYDHQKIWDAEIKGSSSYNHLNDKEYDYYPRGRVEVSRGWGYINVALSINKMAITDEVAERFGLMSDNISRIMVMPEISGQYKSFLDKK